MLEKCYEIYKDAKIDAVAGVESRGFIFAAPLAEKLGIPLVLIRKKGKLPGDTYECSYALEYGTATIEVHKEDIKKGQNVLIVDDLIATGGTLAAAKNLIEMGGGEVTDFFGVIGLPFLNYEREEVYYDYLAGLRRLIRRKRQEERETLDFKVPEIHELQRMVTEYDSRLYERSPEDEDFLQVSLGFRSS